MLFPILSTKQSGKVRWADDLLTCGKTKHNKKPGDKQTKKWNLLREKFL